MTRHIVRGYISDATAKSVVGIGTPDIQPRQTHAASVFFIVVSTRTSELWWGVWGSRKARRLVDPVVPTLYVSPPNDWNLTVVMVKFINQRALS
ncbi:hypothetical protein G8G26_004321 [Escherichia coli]|nr:hypothetical protein [Escherichia coli]